MKSRSSRSDSRAGLALALLATVLVASLPASAGSPVDQVQRGFEQIDDYIVMKDGEKLEAKIYSSSETRAILLVPSDLSTPSVILWPRSREVESLKSMKVQSRPGGYVEIKKDAVDARHAPFEVVGTNVVFDIDGAEMRLKPKPPILGFNDTPSMLEKSPVYATRAQSYAPDEAALDRLAEVGRQVRVRVYFGTWCPACGQMVPRILSVADKLDAPNVAFEFYGLPRQGFSDDPQAKAWNIKSVPTGVVFVDDLEVGRIEGNDWRSPESAILARIGA